MLHMLKCVTGCRLLVMGVRWATAERQLLVGACTAVVVTMCGGEGECDGVQCGDLLSPLLLGTD